MAGEALRVFCSYRSSDAVVVEAFARRLWEDAGIEAWLDLWEIAAGDDIVARMGTGIDQSDAGLVFVSEAWVDGQWAQDEYTSLVFRRVEEGIRVIPVAVGELPSALPTSLRKLARRTVDDFDEIVDALRGVDRRPGLRNALSATTRAVTVTVTERPDGAADIALAVDGASIAQVADVRVPAGVALSSGMSSVRVGDVGARVGKLVFPGAVGAEVERVLAELGAGDVVDLCFAVEGESVAGLPLEAAALSDGRVPALVAGVRVWRRVGGSREPRVVPAPGPLKVLVAVGAPDEDQTASVPLDIEREMGSILEAVSQAVRDERAHVRVLEVASADAIREALAEDDYHVLHLSGHGSATSIELEDEDGRAVVTSAETLIDAFRASGKLVPLVFLSSCHGARDSAGIAVELHRLGVPRVVAMQSPVSDSYATELAAAFYERLSRDSSPRVGVALATARQRVQARRARDAEATGVEWPTATLLLAGGDAPLLDSDLDQVALGRPPTLTLAGVVPTLGWSDLVGRRREVRTTLRALRADDAFTREHGEVGAVVVTGIGGVGKSTIAGRVMTRLAEQGWVCSATAGGLSIDAMVQQLRVDLATAGPAWARALLGQLDAAGENEQARLAVIVSAVRQVPLLLVWDNFEDNLTPGGGAFLDDARASVLQMVVDAASVGKLLVTSRHPLPRIDGVYELAVGPLSFAESRRLWLRLPGLEHLDRDDQRLVASLVGGHPRMLELLDALLRRGSSIDRIRPKLRKLAVEEHIDMRADRDVATSISDATRLGARDILLDELIEELDDDEREVLLQTAVSGLPVALEDLAGSLTALGLDHDRVSRATRRLRDMSLLVDTNDGYWVHRWTAQALGDRQPPDELRARSRRAGEMRLERIRTGQRDVSEGIEATENLLAADAWDEAASIALRIVDFLTGRSTVQLLGFASFVRRGLPEDHPASRRLADHEARASHVLGFTRAAVDRYLELVASLERMVAAEPDRSDLLGDLSRYLDRLGTIYRDLGRGDGARDAFSRALEIDRQLARSQPDNPTYQQFLAVSYSKLGDLLGALGQGEQARELYSQSVEIARQLTAAEPDRADFQRDLTIFSNKLGDLLAALGQGEQARELYTQSLEIRRRLAAAEPDRADYQRDLSVSYDRLGDLLDALGQGEQARELYTQSLEIRRRLAAAEPERADYQRDLSISYTKLGDLLGALGQGEQARQLHTQSLEIARRLAAAEPDRADYQRDLSVSYERLGDLLRALGQGEQAREHFTQGLEIHRRLAAAEPERADHQRDLSVSYDRLGDLLRALGQGGQARELHSQSLEIRRRLAAAEPGRADYQRDLSISYNKLGDLLRALGQGEQAREFYTQSIEIAGRLAAAEPDHAIYQGDLAISNTKLGDLLSALGQREQARELYMQSLEIALRLAAAAPGRADYQRNLSIAYERLGDLLSALGEREQARELYTQSLEITERLAAAEPDRADYQRNLSIAYERLGDLLSALGQGERARELYTQSLEIAERLAAAEPDRADYQRDLSVSYDRLASLLGALGQGEQARELYTQSLEIVRRLVAAEPDRTDYQRDLLIASSALGDLLRASGEGERARELYTRCLEIAERLVAAEPDRADYKHDLAAIRERLDSDPDAPESG